MSCFLNQLPDFVKSTNKPFSTCPNYDRFDARFVFVQIDNPKISFSVTIGHKINVTATIDFIKSYFTKKESAFYSYLRKGGKLRTKAKYQNHIFYELTFTYIFNSTFSLYKHRNMIYHSQHDFSAIFYYFCKKIEKVGMPFIYDTFAIYDFIRYFVTHRKSSITSFIQLKEEIHGYILFEIQKSKIKKRLAKITYKDESYYIKGGIFISPFAKSIITENHEQISCFLLDTTWKVLPYYVCSFLMASIKNVGIPLAFSFGNSENKKLYNRHFTVFKQKLGIDLEKFIFQSDQGSALKGVFKDRNIKYFLCTRHLLKSLSFNEFSYSINNIVKCCTIDELQKAFFFYSEMFREIKDERKKQLLNRMLKKIGLTFDGKIILVSKSDKWDKFSHLQRLPFKVPSTTNSLESFHGHLNSHVARRNNFFTQFLN